MVSYRIVVAPPHLLQSAGAVLQARGAPAAIDRYL